MRQNALIFFMKAPVMGRVKTRLAEGIGNEHATTLYRLMCEYLLNLTVPQNTDAIVAYDDEECTVLPAYLEGKALVYQSGNDLGERMQNAFEAVFAKGYTRAILVGSDIPDVDERLFEEAFAHLCNHDAMLSPTEDGGYYLIGFHAHTFCKEAFEGIPYSQSDVYANTLLKLSPLRVAKGEMLRDIDTLEDLRAFTCNEKTPLGKFAQDILNDLPRISVIIPVYHEDETLLHTLSHLKAMAHAQNYEIIVVDTHERTTVERLHVSAVRVAFSNKGRSSQMNEGARKARGELLLFLHADTLLPYHWDQKIESALHVTKAGAFSLGINDSHLGLFCIETLANLRTQMTKIPYGDQAHFFQASFFRSLGGYVQIALMEDVEMMKRLKKRGEKIALLKSKVLTSPRRWHKEGILYVTLRNRALSFLYWVGVSPIKLSQFYKTH
jgi:uncharacterized protein